MSRRVTVKLTTPISVDGKPVAEIILKEPGFDLYLQLGDPYTTARSREGTLFMVPRDEIIRDYVEKCLVSPDNPHDLMQISGLADAMKIRSAVLGFFSDSNTAIAEGQPSASSLN